MLLTIPLALTLLAHAPPTGPAARDTCRLPAATDTVTRSVVATLEPADPADSLPAGYARQFLAEVSRNLELPSPLRLFAYERLREGPDPGEGSGVPGAAEGNRKRVRTDPEAPVRAGQAFQLLLGLRLGDSTQASVRLIVSSLDPAADSAFLGAVQRIIAAGLATSPLGRAVETRLLLRSADTVAPSDLVLFRFRTPLVSMRQAAGRSAVMPRVPPALRGRRGSAVVNSQFVIDAAGRFVPGSLRFVSLSHRELAVSIAEELPSYRFKPAVVGGCPVGQVMEMSWYYSFR